MDDQQAISGLSAEALRAQLAANLNDLSDEQIEAVEDFILRIGGIENAMLAVEMLDEIERAA